MLVVIVGGRGKASFRLDIYGSAETYVADRYKAYLLTLPTRLTFIQYLTILGSIKRILLDPWQKFFCNNTPRPSPSPLPFFQTD